ncbi:alpha/beta fold hydrolase [Streptomyces sp. NPDC002888]|uniref:alpha/beta fold hydrolase n=1 Tax=Streptomyces sp. NPDC002888 TaxID=3364668 RepID=UPI0036838924
MSQTADRTRADVGRYVSDAWRDRYFAACDAVYALGAPALAEQDVDTSYGTTHVYRYGPADPEARSRTPVVLIHGAGSCSAMWYPNTPDLSTDRPVYALDTPGDPGRSVQRAPIHQPEHAAQWMDETLAGLGLDRVHLVGTSYGGWLALNQAHRRPDRLASASSSIPAAWRRWGCASSSGSSPACSRPSLPGRYARVWRRGWSSRSSSCRSCAR